MDIDKGAVFWLGFMLALAGLITVVAKSIIEPSLSPTVDLFAMAIGVFLMAVSAVLVLIDRQRM